MALCNYCGTKLDDNAKFCTGCGAKVEQAAPVQESAPIQGSYEAPVQGSYTAPTQSYTPPVQQPTAAAADSGSYTPPVQSYSAPQQNYSAGGYTPKGKAPKAAGGKRKLGPIIGIAAALLLVIILVASCGGKDKGAAAADDPNLGIYNAVSAEMMGFEISVTDMFENGVSIELMEKGKCKMDIDGTTGKGTWSLEDGVFSAEAGGAELNGTLSEGVLYAENVMDMGINLTFEKEGGYIAPAPEADGQGNAAEDISAALPGESGVSELQKQWNGTWYGMMYVYDAEGDFASISSDEYDTYMVVDVDAEGKGTMEVYLDGVEPYAAAECQVYDYGIDVISGTILEALEMDPYNWMFRQVPDYPGRYSATDTIEYDDSLFDYSLFFKKWGASWQDEVDGDELLPPSLGVYEEAIANGELPPVGFAPLDYAGGEPAPEEVIEEAAEEAIAAPAPEAAQPTSSGFGGTHSFTVDEFMTEIEATFTFELPESGWVTEAPNRTVYIYNVPTLDVAHSAAPRIQFELKENMEKIDFYKDQFENLKDESPRVISGIEFEGRSYRQHGMDWIEYYGELPNGVWLSAKISDVDISDGTEGAEILDSVSIN